MTLQCNPLQQHQPSVEEDAILQPLLSFTVAHAALELGIGYILYAENCEICRRATESRIYRCAPLAARKVQPAPVNQAPARELSFLNKPATRGGWMIMIPVFSSKVVKLINLLWFRKARQAYPVMPPTYRRHPAGYRKRVGTAFVKSSMPLSVTTNVSSIL